MHKVGSEIWVPSRKNFGSPITFGHSLGQFRNWMANISWT